MIARAALIGLGTMGPGIAARLERGGIDVAAFDVSEAAIARRTAMLPNVQCVLSPLGISAPHKGAGKKRESGSKYALRMPSTSHMRSIRLVSQNGR